QKTLRSLGLELDLKFRADVARRSWCAASKRTHAPVCPLGRNIYADRSLVREPPGRSPVPPPSRTMTERAAITEDIRRALAAEEGSRRWLRRVAALGVVAALVGGGLVFRAKNRPAPPARYVTASPSVGDVAEKVQATGAVQPVLQVNVGAQVNGRVATVKVDFNSVVKKGDILAVIDPTVYGAQVNQVVAQLATQRAQLESAKANAAASKVAFDRTRRLFEQSLAAKGELDTAQGQYDVARAQVDAAQAQIGAIQAQLDQSRTNIGWTK